MSLKAADRPDGSPERPVSATGPRVSIIIPVFNQVRYTRICLDRLFANSPLALCQIIVVDNHSTDATPQLLGAYGDAIRVIRNHTNLGFAAACNQGARAATAPYLLFLNNDTEVQPGWLEPLLETIDSDPDIAAVGSRLHFPDGTLQHAGVIMIAQPGRCPLLPMHVFFAAHPDAVPARQPMLFQAVTAACMLVDKTAFGAAGGFDEIYWNGSEDMDLCFKLRSAGRTVAYQPRSLVIHHESKSGRERQSARFVNDAILRDRWERFIPPDLLQDGTGTRPAPGSPVRALGQAGLDAAAYLDTAAAWWDERQRRLADSFMNRLRRGAMRFYRYCRRLPDRPADSGTVGGRPQPPAPDSGSDPPTSPLPGRDPRQLRRWLWQLERDFQALEHTRQWRLGNAIVRTLERARLRPRTPAAVDRLRLTARRFRAWADHHDPGQIDELSTWLDQFDDAYRAFTGARPWRVGRRATTLLDRLLLRIPQPMITDRIEAIFIQFRRLGGNP